MADIDRLMNRRYKIELRQLTEEDGGGWFAEIPALKGCCADGETPEEALQNLNEAKRAWFETALEIGREIPDSDADENEEQYSGRFVVRLPKSMHRRLAQLAKQNGVSMNQYVNVLIALGLGMMQRQAPSFVTNFKDVLNSFAMNRPFIDVTEMMQMMRLQSKMTEGGSLR